RIPRHADVGCVGLRRGTNPNGGTQPRAAGGGLQRAEPRERSGPQRHVRRYDSAAPDIRPGEPGPRECRSGAHGSIPGAARLLRRETQSRYHLCVSMSAIDLSSVVGLVAVGLLTANILLGLLISSGYNPTRRWPRRRVKLFPFHKWTGYSALAVAFVHPVILLFSSTAGFRPLDIAFPIRSPTQPFENTLGAAALYLVAFAVITSYFRYAIGFHRWKLFHYTTDAAAAVF